MIGYADQQINRDSAEMAALLLDPWLEAWPEADVALADPRYVQQDLYPGEITVASIWGLLPTPNELVEVELTGAHRRSSGSDRSGPPGPGRSQNS